MREIKFRAWDPKENKMWNENHIVVGDGVYRYGGHNTVTLVFTYTEENHLIPLQFTGLRDKNGRDVYEGDIIGIPNYDYSPENGESPRRLVEVKFEDSCFCTNEGLLGDEEYMEVIGNIYENPELLAK